jgi:diguanylate cyclase (GGDEF)-like protein
MAVFGISLAALLAALVLVWSRNERMRELQRQASQDPLTRLKNRRRFEEDLRTELARSRRERSTGALLMLDLDNFKQVNDTLGHPVGDRVIEEIAGVLGNRMRETDVLARVGGDEFAIVLPRCDAAEAEQVGETIATAIREHVPQPDEVPSITVSVGIATFGPRYRSRLRIGARRGRRRDVRGEGGRARRHPGRRPARRRSARQPVTQAQHAAGRGFEVLAAQRS